MGYICFLVPIWVNAPKASAKDVFTKFENYGGWETQGLAILVGQLSGISPQIGVDTVCIRRSKQQIYDHSLICTTGSTYR